MSDRLTSDYVEDYLERILSGDRRAALDLIHRIHSAGMPVIDLYEMVIGPAMHELGDLWYRNEISVAEEHVATAVSELILVHCYDWLLEEIEPQFEGTAVLACPGKEQHHLGLRMFADILEAMGLQTYYCGPRTPASEIPRLVRRVDADLVALSVSMPTHLPVLNLTLSKLQRDAPDLPVLIGGRALSDRDNTLHRTKARFTRTLNADMKLTRELLAG
ncbi:MAG: B12-binding domain-containing protein [Clostridia bacterium]